MTDADVAEARAAEARAKADLERVVHEIQRTHGALEQVGGSVARERLRDAVEAFESAERREREIEAEYEAWLLLLEQMKEADAAQASNLGQTLGPAIAGRFEELTQKRYENVRLTAQLGTEGVVVGGAVRSTDRMSVGTREQLSTLYRLSLAEYSEDVRRPGQSAGAERRRADGLVPRLADRQGPGLSDRRVHVSPGGLPGRWCHGADQGEVGAQGYGGRIHPGGGSGTGDSAKVGVFTPREAQVTSSVLTTDADFRRFATVLPIVLHGDRTPQSGPRTRRRMIGTLPNAGRSLKESRLNLQNRI